MKKSAFKKYPMGTLEYVALHGRYKASRGRKPSACLPECRNPKQAFEFAKVLAYFPVTTNLTEARKVAQIFRRFEKVQAVEVFGSVARGKDGKDLDLILVCDEETSQDFMEKVAFEATMVEGFGEKVALYFGFASTRSGVAEEVLILNTADDDHYNDAVAKCPVSIDIFMFPPDWRERLDELQARMRHDDPEFMRNIAKDARRIA